MNEKMKALNKNQTREIVDLLKGKKKLCGVNGYL